jgi:hypothetical protein
MKLLEAQHLSSNLCDPGKRNPLPLAQKESLNAGAGLRRDEMQIILREYPFDQARWKKSALQGIQRLASLQQGFRPTLRPGFRTPHKEIDQDEESCSNSNEQDQLNH